MKVAGSEHVQRLKTRRGSTFDTVRMPTGREKTAHVFDGTVEKKPQWLETVEVESAAPSQVERRSKRE